MPFYFFAIRHWVKDVNDKHVACIELAVPQKNLGNLMDLSDVKSVNDLMNKKAIPIKSFTFKNPKDLEEGEVVGGSVSSEYERLTGQREETLGESLERNRREKQARKEAELRLAKKKKHMPKKSPSPRRASAAVARKQDPASSSIQPKRLVHEFEQQDAHVVFGNEQRYGSEHDDLYSVSTVYSEDNDETSLRDDDNSVASGGSLASAASVASQMTLPELKEIWESWKSPQVSGSERKTLYVSCVNPKFKSSMKVKTQEASLKLSPRAKVSKGATRSKSGRSLRWGEVQTRMYPICLGDNPACSHGVPIQLGWDYEERSVIKILEMAHWKQEKKVRRLSSAFRKEALLNRGVTLAEIKAAVTQKATDRKLRVKTVANLSNADLDDTWDKIKRKPSVAADDKKRKPLLRKFPAGRTR